MSGFCYQQGFASPTRPVDRKQFDALVDAPLTAQLISQFRQTGDARWKRRLPAFIFQSTFDETSSKKGLKGSWRKQSATRLTGLVVMDVDHVDDPLAKYQQWGAAGIDFGREGILLVYITPSGHGLKVVFKARTKWGNLIDNQHRMALLLGVDIDESCKDSSRMSFVCRREDILFINSEELFTYENKKFAEKYNAQYRGGNSQPTLDRAPGAAAGGDGGNGSDPAAMTYGGVSLQKIVDAWLEGKNVERGNRNNMLLLLAKDMRYITTTNPERLTQLLRQLCPWVSELEKDGDNIQQVVKNACEYRYYATQPKSLREALEHAGCAAEKKGASDIALPLALWGEQIRRMGADFPCINEIGHGLSDEAMPAALFASAAMLGTLMTRTWYHFYHRPNETRRLNYCVYIIGDPGSGKSFAAELYKVLMAPIIASDQVGYDALNKWKREKNERGTSAKEQKKEKLEKPQVVIRIHPARTSNGVFIEDMRNAVEVVGKEQMHLHLFTFDSELDNNTRLSGSGGSWIDRQVMELKAFHNEEDGQAYANTDSVMGMFNVYWNFVYTGTIRSLEKKTQGIKGVASGLTNRLGVIPMPKTSFEMMPLDKPNGSNDGKEVLKEWATRLDTAHGELPLWPLVRECWEWTRDHMALAQLNEDPADELLIKRVAYYGIAISAPFVLMRHWQQWEKEATFDVDETDLRLCCLALDIQYQTQHYFFGEATRNYFADLERDGAGEKRRAKKTQIAYGMLPSTFTVADVERTYETTPNYARVVVSRLIKDGIIEKNSNNTYAKIKKQL